MNPRCAVPSAVCFPADTPTVRDGTRSNVAFNDGYASLTLSASQGTQTITARYPGSPDYLTSTSTAVSMTVRFESGGSVGGAVRQGVGDEFVGRHPGAAELGRVVSAIGFDELACPIAEAEIVVFYS
jgi:hypothetical protein